MLSELDKLKELRYSISKAREACAGSNIWEYDKVNTFLLETTNKAVSLGFVDISIKLDFIIKSLRLREDQRGRLDADSKLCDILNDLDKRIRSLE